MNNQEALKADTSFFSVFRELIENGTLAELGVYSWAVYTVIKSYAGYRTGEAFPSIETIAIKSGISQEQVKRSLKQLEIKGLITKRKEGRRNIYALTEIVTLHGQDNQAVAKASFAYVPYEIKETLAELRDVLLTGDLKGSKTIHIERLQVNIFNSTAHDNATINNSPVLTDHSPREDFLKLKEKLSK